MSRADAIRAHWGDARFDDALELARVALEPSTDRAEKLAIEEALFDATLATIEPCEPVIEACRIHADLATALHGVTADATWRAVATLAQAQRRCQRFDDALATAEHALELARAHGAKSKLIASALLICADTLLDAGRLMEAEQAFRATLTELHATKRERSDAAALVRSRLSGLVTSNAERERLVAAQLATATDTLESAFLARDLAALQLGRKPELARETVQRAVELFDQTPSRPEGIQLLTDLAGIAEVIGDQQDVRTLLERAHALARQFRGERHPRTVELATRIAALP